MGSRDKDQTTSHHQPLLSSLVVRPSASDGAAGGGGGGGGRGGGSDYEPGEVRREPPPYSRSDRHNDEPGYRIRAGSSSPVRHRDVDHRYGSNFDRSGGPSRSRDFGNGRDPGRYRDSSPPYSRGPGGGRPHNSRGFDGTAYGPAPFRGEGMTRNNPNVHPREGDWICPDPSCGNLNFARREYCNNCRRFRYAPVGSPRGGYPGPPPSHAPPRRFPCSPRYLSPPGRNMNGFRSPPRGWAREFPRDFGVGGPPPPRHEGKFSDHSMRRDRLDYLDDDYRGKSRFDRPLPLDWGHRDRGRDNFFNERKGYERRPPSPPPQLPPRGRWPRDERERSRSPIRGGPPPKEYRRDMYLERGREDHRGVGRDRMGDAY
ncbi:transcription initiation factor TFIID subunit 15-like [Durio zibethinus]|uniref:Transcription initiation factor TFIID subunit 15-like n=1 Tax=Durio zibethinus TaxID=66656 RepID=A0A6P5XV05_DURZI|nr:transcription initiation factor TFIID subunit 15-like [Durio zibethinus]